MTNSIGIGHNNAPLDEHLIAQLREVTDNLEERKAAALASLDKVVIRDQEDLGRVGDTARIFKAMLDDVEEKRSSVLVPIYEARDRVNTFADRWTAPLEAGRDQLAAKVDAFRDDQKRKAKEQQDEQRRIEQARAAAAGVAIPPPPTPAATHQQPERSLRARGEYGGRVSERAKVEVSIEDMTLLPDYILNSKPVQEAILKVARQFATNLDEIPGIKIDRGLKTSFT